MRDIYTHTEHDAARFEQAYHAPDDDRPDLADLADDTPPWIKPAPFVGKPGHAEFIGRIRARVDAERAAVRDARDLLAERAQA